MTTKIRRLVQIFFLLFFIFLFFQARYPYENQLDSDIFLRFSPLIPLFDFINNLSISFLFWPALIILLITPFLGRVFCGWICPLGTTLDICDKAIKPPSNRVAEKWQKFTRLKFVLLIGLVILAIFSVHAWGYFDPLSLFNRFLAIVFYPVFTLATESILLGMSNIPFLEDTTYTIYDNYKEYIMPENQANYQQVFWIALLFIVIVAGEKLSRRFWCRYFCPAGAWLGFLSQWRLFERIVGEECPVCNKCQRECKMNAIPKDAVAYTNKVECIECFSCGETCPPKTKSITYRWRWKPYHSKVDFERRSFMVTSAASLAALGLIKIGLPNKEKESRLVRPPGSLEEDLFQDRCIRCMECVRICESNGGCLQPDQIHSSVLQLWLPVAVMREGYCEFNCNLCGQVCPTEAILPLSVKEKQKTSMGLAYFDKNLCIPFAQNKDCLVCEEHCPTPDKAIKFEIKEVLQPNGQIQTIKYPYVDLNLCIGCGICENKCPLPGEPGVFVTIENQQRLTPQM